MKKFLALLLSVSMLLIPMTAFADAISSNVRYVYDDVIIEGKFTDPDTETEINETKDKIATLIVLNQGKVFSETNLLTDPKLILWADQCTVGENGEFKFTIDTFEFPDYTGSGAGYDFHISAPGVAQPFDGSFYYTRAQMEAKLVEQLNSVNTSAAGMHSFINEVASARITRVAKEYADANPGLNFDKDVVEDYKTLNENKKNSLCSAMISSKNRPYQDMTDFVRKLRATIDTLTTTTPSDGGSGGSGGGGGSTGGGGGFGGAAGGGLIAPAGTVNPFLDISNNYWGKDAIINLYNKGIVKGQGNGYFRPDNTITRAEFVQMVVVAFNFIMQGKTPEFADVTDSDWFANSVKIAFGNGVVKGTTDTTFSPTKNITRQDMMTILYNAAKAKGINLTSGNASFTDAASISGYAQEAVAAMVGSNVVSGYTDGSVKPLNNASRAEAAAMLSRLLEVR